MKCNLIIPGFAKCGTTSLRDYLDLHPEIHMSPKKEPHYFSRDSVYDKGPIWYDQLFDKSNPKSHIFGEASTSYAYDKKALGRIKRDLPNVKLILVLRDPVERLLSHYRWLCSLGYENKPLQDALNEESNTEYSAEVFHRGTYKTYVRASNYSEYVPYILDEFGIERVHLVRSVDLLQNPQQEINKCYDFLNLPRMNNIQHIETNKTSDQKKQNYWGLDYVAACFPKSIKKRLGIQWYLWLLKRLGKSTVEPAIVDSREISIIKNMLTEDTDYFNQLFINKHS